MRLVPVPLPRPLQPRYWGVHLLALVLVASRSGSASGSSTPGRPARTAEAVDLTRVDPMPLDDALGPDDPFPGDMVGPAGHRRRHLAGPRHRLVSGREHDGQDGYWVVTPARRSGPPTGRPCWSSAAGPGPSRTRRRRRRGTAELVAWLQPTEGSGRRRRRPRRRRPARAPGRGRCSRRSTGTCTAATAWSRTTSPRVPGRAGRAVNDGTDGLTPATWTSCRRPGGSPRCATCSTRSSGGSSAASPGSSGGAGCGDEVLLERDRLPGSLSDVKSALTRYRVLATSSACSWSCSAWSACRCTTSRARRAATPSSWASESRSTSASPTAGST